MTVQRDHAGTIVLSGACPVDEAETLLRLEAALRGEKNYVTNGHASKLAREAIAAEKQRPAAAMAPVNYAYTNHFRLAVETGSFLLRGLKLVNP